MKESDFIQSNLEKWERFEKELDTNTIDPEKLTDIYIDTIDDLSYARTHYPNRLVRSYLNGISQIQSLSIYKSNAAKWSYLSKFWRVDLPLVMYESRNMFALAFLVLLLSVIIGVVSSIYDPQFPAYILSENYVNMTLENIEKGDPMAVYKDAEQGNMFLGITFNNLMVSVYTYMGSFFFGIGTLFSLISNGIMLGTFQYFFYEKGLFAESALTIWQHGVIEITSIVLAGTAGFVLSKGILFPGTYSRLDAFRFAGRKSLFIVLGLMPFLVYSGAVEAFFTRYTEVPSIFRLLTIILSLGFVFIYLIWYPRKVAKAYSAERELDMFLNPVKSTHFKTTDIETNFTIIWEAFRLISKKRKPYIITILVISIVGFIIQYLNSKGLFLLYDIGSSTPIDFSTTQSNILFRELDFWSFIYNCTLFTTAAFLSNHLIQSVFKKDLNPAFISKLLTAVFIGVFTAALITYPLASIAVLVIIPAIGLMPNLEADLQKKWAFKTSFSMAFGSKNWKKSLSLTIVTLFFGYFILQLFSSFVYRPLSLLLFKIMDFDYDSVIFKASTGTLYTLLYFNGFLILYTVIGLNYYSLKEITYANQLRNKVDQLFKGSPIKSKVSLLNKLKIQ